MNKWITFIVTATSRSTGIAWGETDGKTTICTRLSLGKKPTPLKKKARYKTDVKWLGEKRLIPISEDQGDLPNLQVTETTESTEDDENLHAQTPTLFDFQQNQAWTNERGSGVTAASSAARTVPTGTRCYLHLSPELSHNIPPPPSNHRLLLPHIPEWHRVWHPSSCCRVLFLPSPSFSVEKQMDFTSSFLCSDMLKLPT